MKGIYYRANVSDEKKIEQMVEHFDNDQYRRFKFDFPLEDRWLTNHAHYDEDFESSVKRAYHAWAKGCGSLYGQMPTHFKGMAVDVGLEDYLLGLIFGRFAYDDWRCQSFLDVDGAIDARPIYTKAVGILKEFEQFVDKLVVDDKTGLWRPEAQKL